MQNLLIVIADHNDADYITKVTEISDKDLMRITPVINAIRLFKPYKVKNTKFKYTVVNNYPTREQVRSDLGEKSAEEL